MSILDLNQEREHLERIKSALKRRGMSPEIKELEWEVHGPHPDMNYQIYIGYGNYILEEGGKWLVIYPRAVYELPDQDPDNWWKVSLEDKIWTL